jgi:hypothetical protein
MKQQMSLAFDNLQQSQQKFTSAEADYNKSNEEYNQHNIIITRQQSRINEINNERKYSISTNRRFEFKNHCVRTNNFLRNQQQLAS